MQNCCQFVHHNLNQMRTIMNVKLKFEDIKNLLKESTCLWRTWCHIRRGLWINKICDGNWTNLQIIGNITSNSLDIKIYKWQMTMNKIQASLLNMSFYNPSSTSKILFVVSRTWTTRMEIKPRALFWINETTKQHSLHHQLQDLYTRRM